MVSGDMFNGIGRLLLYIVIASLFIGGGVVYILGKDKTFTTSEPIRPEIKLVVKDNVVDTLYVYKYK